jgi:hypothetical protein
VVKEKGQTNLWSKKKDRQTCGQRKRTDKLVVKEKGQTNLWSKKKDKQLFTKHNPQNSPTATRNLWSLAVFHDPYFAVPLRIWRKKVDASLISSNDLASFDHRVLDFCDKV